MADHPPAMPAEVGAEMDYPQHEKSYRLFVALAKYGTLHVLAVLIALAFGFFTSAGFFSSLILFILISAVGIYLLRSAPEHIA
ncbi:MAG TPA: aa3-type cytochrome c oxidase subunit IV [Rhizobiaceae bacterium]|nr:aa3-type cytochrome c oxidase subunit IV [Rhizobiaceae bacterium]